MKPSQIYGVFATSIVGTLFTAAGLLSDSTLAGKIAIAGLVIAIWAFVVALIVFD